MADDFHFRREDRTNRWQRIADHLSRNPQDLEIALKNIERWLSWGRVNPGPILEWRSRILSARNSEENFREFIDALAKDDCNSNPLKSCSPFAGLTFSRESSAVPIT